MKGNEVNLEYTRHMTRRHFLRDCQLGIGSMALATLLHRDTKAGIADKPLNPLAPKRPHFDARAKSVIFLHMAGSPPHLDLFDYKPELVKRDGELCPDEFYKGKRFAFTSARPKLLGTPQKFSQHGQCGAWVADILPNIAKVVDDITFIKSMNTDQFNHAPAQMFLYTGSPRMGRPAMGAWVTYGLGSENENLPGYVVLISGGTNPSAGKSAWGSGFLPTVYQGVQCRSKGDPVLYLSNPKGMDRDVRRLSLDALRDLNELQARELGHPETVTRIAQYELAYRMQISAPEVMDVSRETRQTLEMYGAQPGDGSFASNCLLARRLVEQGVRFVQLFDWGWDFHGTSPSTGIGDGLAKRCQLMDRPVAALLTDLKARGLLDETLVIWSGEFGRTPFREGRTAKSKVLGRDHYPDCYTMFLAGGGIKRGFTFGASDELGFTVAENKVHVHDLQATILHLLGLDHEKLTYRYQGRDFRLTDVFGHVVHDILA
ncbi:MAG: sulfatase [Gemmatales bacterium]|nr:MAG: sulfatase [Gemmatales bacterium]